MTKCKHYGARFDKQIIALVGQRRTLVSIARKLKVSNTFIGYRGRELGLADQIYRNGCAAKAVASRKSWKGVEKRRALIAKLCRANGDQLVSVIASRLCSRPAELTDNAIAALHERGLTVDELCVGAGRHPLAIVKAIREAAQCA